MKKFRLNCLILALCLLCISSALGAKRVDPYKVLGVDKNASQREIQKAFHKLSLQYHPDKNKNKGAQAKFEEINNAYEILSDEEKRKNYDLYGDEMGNPGFQTGNPGFNMGNPKGRHGGYTYFTGGGPGQGHFSFRPGDWQSMGDMEGSKTFSYSFGSSGGDKPFGFNLDDMFSGFFGGGGGQFGGFKSSSRPQQGSRSSPNSIKAVNSQVFKKEIVDQGMTWLLIFDTPTLMNNKAYDSSLDDILPGVVKVGRVNCEDEPSFCKDLGAYPRRAPRIFVYSYASSDSGSLLEYKGDLGINSIKKFFQEHLPRFSKRVEQKNLESLSDSGNNLPKVLLLSTKKDTSVIWRALSGLHHKHIDFYDTQVHNVFDPIVQKLGVDSLPAIVGWLSNGEKQVLKTGISVKDMKSAVHELSALLDGFMRKNKKASSQTRKPQADSGSKHIPILSGSNYDTLCGENTPLCIIGAFRSTKGREKLESILHAVSQKSFSRHQSGSRDSLSFCLLDANKQSAFLTALDKSGFKTFDKILVAYKPKRGKFAVSGDEITVEAAEGFIGSALNGDVQFRKTRQKPVLT